MDLDEALAAYQQQFGDVFPGQELSLKGSDELHRAVLRCLAEGRSAQDVFGLKYDDENVKY